MIAVLSHFCSSYGVAFMAGVIFAVPVVLLIAGARKKEKHLPIASSSRLSSRLQSYPSSHIHRLLCLRSSIPLRTATARAASIPEGPKELTKPQRHYSLKSKPAALLPSGTTSLAKA